MEKTATKTKILSAFDKSETKTVLDLCRIVGIAPNTFYYHFNKDAEFRKSVMEKQREHLNAKIEAMAA